MSLPFAEALALALQCAPTVAPETLLSVVQVESSFNPLAIGVNGAPRTKVAATSPRDAVVQARGLMAAGRNIDLGLAQINSRNLAWLGLTVEDAFDPCRNLAAAARVLQVGYGPSAEIGEQPALLRALSRYNTGGDTAGFRNGYIAKVTAAATRIVPVIRGAAVAPTLIQTAEAPPRPAWDVFGQSAGGGFVIRLSTPRPTSNGAPQ
jgi:type IV secretion system protein VirB1